MDIKRVIVVEAALPHTRGENPGKTPQSVLNCVWVPTARQAFREAWPHLALRWFTDERFYLRLGPKLAGRCWPLTS